MGNNKLCPGCSASSSTHENLAFNASCNSSGDLGLNATFVDASRKNLNSPLPHAPKLDIRLPKKQKPRLGRVLPPPQRSACLYVQIKPKDIAMFKFLLEAEDNLGYMSVVDRWSAALKVVYSPHQQKAMQAWLADTAKALQFKEIWLNRN